MAACALAREGGAAWRKERAREGCELTTRGGRKKEREMKNLMRGPHRLVIDIEKDIE